MKQKGKKKILSSTGVGAIPILSHRWRSCAVGVCSQSSHSTLSPDVCVWATQRKKLPSRVNNTQLPIASSTVVETLRVSWLNSLTSVLKETSSSSHTLPKIIARELYVCLNYCLVHVAQCEQVNVENMHLARPCETKHLLLCHIHWLMMNELTHTHSNCLKQLVKRAQGVTPWTLQLDEVKHKNVPF